MGVWTWTKRFETGWGVKETRWGGQKSKGVKKTRGGPKERARYRLRTWKSHRLRTWESHRLYKCDIWWQAQSIVASSIHTHVSFEFFWSWAACFSEVVFQMEEKKRSGWQVLWVRQADDSHGSVEHPPATIERCMCAREISSVARFVHYVVSAMASGSAWCSGR